MNSVYTRTFSFPIAASSTVASGVIGGITIPPGTLLLGGVIKPTKASDGTILSLGGTATLAFNTVTSNVIFSAATAYTAETALVNSIPLMVPTTATANDTISVALAAASSPASDMIIYVTLVLCPVGLEPATYTTLTT